MRLRLSSRLDGFRSYLGTEMNARLSAMREAGVDVINLGLGDPDFEPPSHLLRSLKKAVEEPSYHHYPSFYSGLPLREAISSWYEKRFGVKLDPEREVLPLLGSSDGVFHIHQCLLDTGDMALVPSPGYPSYEAGVRIAGGEVVYVPLLKKNHFLPDLDAIPPKIAERAKMIWVNYPNNPTSAIATGEFFRRLIDWAYRFDVVVVHDNPYSEIFFEGYRPPSFLEFEGAKEVGVELHSLSKSYNCCGWRVGMVVGNSTIVQALAKIKSHADRGIYYPLQVAAMEALNGPTAFMEQRNRVVQERRDVLVSGLKALGFEMESPKATFYLWASIPGGHPSHEFCLNILEKTGVWMMPGSMYGQWGEGFVRAALTLPIEKLEEAVRRLARAFS